MNPIEIAKLKDDVLNFLDRSKRHHCLSTIIYSSLNPMIDKRKMPIEVFRAYLNEMGQEGVVSLQKISRDRVSVIITDAGRRKIFEGGYLGECNNTLAHSLELKDQFQTEIPIRQDVKELIFISYSSDDIDKVDIIERILTSNLYFGPLIIERIEEPNKALVNKVKDGLRLARIIIPILTKRSIYTQWVNQEIGYAFCLEEKEIIPIVDISLIDTDALRGFIHKQNDLPFKFKGNTNRGQENRSFALMFKKVLKYLEEKKLKQKILLHKHNIEQ